MGGTTMKFRTSDELTAEEAAERLSQLALGFATGELWVKGEPEQEPLHPDSPIKLDIKGEEDNEDGKLVIELSWKTSLRIHSFPPLREPARKGGP
jgi:amphi-Trp domain-containing protein